MNTIKHIFQRYTALVWALLKPLGAWGVFAIAGIDSSFVGMPLDPVVATYVYSNPHRFLLYVIMASAGSAVGSIVLYLIGYKGGEVLLEKKIPKAKFEKIRSSFDRHEFWALMFPAMMPPPFPFKIFVLAAAAFEMRFWHFLLAIFAGRFVRFTILAVLTIKFGPEAMNIARRVFLHHMPLVVGVVLAGLIALLIWRRKKRRVATVVER
ncbi:MAG TPA: VTT domain-containing protein [Terriglobales bacterium]|nr:VTT domain-containing protein [Terriglobales bacterium]